MTNFKKSIFFAVSLLCGILILSQQAVYGQNKSRTVNWSVVRIDSLWNPAGETVTGKIISKYKPTIDPLMEVIGHSAKELQKYPPESPLSNLSTDIISKYAQKYLDENGYDAKVDMAVTNFGGIRTSLPAGDITSFDVLSVFPFDNKIVVIDLKGKYIREMMENFAKKGRTEALSGVEVVINNRKLEKCNIAGAPVDDNKIYKVATIDFLLSGGDNVYALKYASDVIKTGTVLRDAVIGYIEEETAKGRAIDADKDGRVVIINNK